LLLLWRSVGITLRRWRVFLFLTHIHFFDRLFSLRFVNRLFNHSICVYVLLSVFFTAHRAARVGKLCVRRLEHGVVVERLCNHRVAHWFRRSGIRNT
jgi:hypothetical protein